MAYTGTYEQALRKNPTDFKLRAMGKRKYELKRKADGKVTISTKDDPKTREGFGVGKKRVIDSNKKKKKKTLLSSRAKENLKEEMEKIRQGESKQSESKQGESKQREVKTSEDNVRKTDNEGESKKKIESQNQQRKNVNIPSQELENLATGVAGVSLLAGGYGIKKLKDKKKADKMRMASEKFKEMSPNKQKKVMSEMTKKVMEKMKNAKPSLKQKIKTQLAKLKQKLTSGLKSKLTVKTGGSRTGAPAGMGVGGTPFGGKDLDGKRKKTIY